MAFVALMSAQANAKVDMKRRVIRQDLVTINNALVKSWGSSSSYDGLLGLNRIPGGLLFTGPSIRIFYRDSIKSSEGEQESINNFHEVTLSSDPSVVKKLIMRVAYELHLGYQEAKRS